MGNSHSHHNKKPHIGRILHKYNIKSKHLIRRIQKPIQAIVRPVMKVEDQKQQIFKDLARGNFRQALKDFSKLNRTLEDEIDFLEKKLDSKTYGVGSIVLEAVVPEIALSKAILQINEEISSGKPPLRSLKAVAYGLMISYALKDERAALAISKEALQQEQIKQRLMNTKLFKSMKAKIKSKLPNRARQMIDKFY